MTNTLRTPVNTPLTFTPHLFQHRGKAAPRFGRRNYHLYEPVLERGVRNKPNLAFGEALKAQQLFTFSAASAKSPPSPVKFGALRAYDGKYDNALIFTDFNDGASNHEATLQFRDTLEWVLKNREDGDLNGFTLAPWASEQDSGRASRTPGVIDINTFADTPSGNRDYSALTILRLASRSPNNDVFIHVTDPGVGNLADHDRSILVTENYGVLVGPNNGSLGLFIKWLEKQDEAFDLYPIDIQKAEHFERFRWGSEDYVIPESFHARDLFVVVAAAIAGGIDPSNFVDEARAASFKPNFNAFAEEIKPLPLGVGEVVEFSAFQDQTYGNIKTNLTLVQNAQVDQPAQLLAANARYTITNLDSGKKLENVPYKRVFADVPLGDPLTYLGSSYFGTRPQGLRFVEFARHFASISEKLGLELGESKRFSIERTQ